MAFSTSAVPNGQRDRKILSADNSYPDRFTTIDLIRRAAPLLGLKAPVIATLDTLLSCLPPKRNHHTVFASNQTLAFRRDGLTDRSLRRHFALLESAGLIVRQDSANRKRFMRHNPETGMAMRFGLDLSPLFTRMQEIASLAATATRQAEQLRYLRQKLRAIIARLLEREPQHTGALAAKAALRRILTANDIESLTLTLQMPDLQPVEKPASDQGKTSDMASNAGQNVRHHHNSRPEQFDRSPQAVDQTTAEIDIPYLLSTCPEASEYASVPIRTTADVIAQATLLAPMMGIDRSTYRMAEAEKGPIPAALTIWLILSLGPRIKQMGAYFRAVTSGRQSGNFDPWAIIQHRGLRPCA